MYSNVLGQVANLTQSKKKKPHHIKNVIEFYGDKNCGEEEP